MYVKGKGKITNKEYRELTGLSDEGARLDLIELSKRNLIQPIGKGRSAHYIGEVGIATIAFDKLAIRNNRRVG